MLDFMVDKQLCTQCGQCASDCPMHIIDIPEDGPRIAPEKEDRCLRCQHCLAICPTGAVSIAGIDPKNSTPIKDRLPDADQLETLIRARRSIRQFKQENIDRSILQRLLDVAASAPTGKNSQSVRFTVIHDVQKLSQFCDVVMAGLGQRVREGQLPPGTEFVASLYHVWEEQHLDLVFRDAPHLLVASASKTGVSPQPDCFIALTTFDLFAQTLGVGTLWCGFVKFLINDLMPEFQQHLGIPEDHVIGYVMMFGYPAVHYTRTTQRGPANIHWV